MAAARVGGGQAALDAGGLALLALLTYTLFGQSTIYGDGVVYLSMLRHWQMVMPQRTLQQKSNCRSLTTS